jgi:hypothetical protein
MRHVRDAGVELRVLFEHRDEHRVLAALVVAVLIELGEEVAVLLLRGGYVGLVLHLEHDRDVLHVVVAEVPEDVVTLRASGCVVVLPERCVGERERAHAVELDLAMLLEGLAEELDRASPSCPCTGR